MSTILLIVLVVVALVVLWGVAVYNKLVGLKNRVANSWGQIDVQLQRRYDLIPNLIETVKGYMAHEKSTLEAVVEARNQAVAARKALQEAGGPASGESLQQLMGAETALKGALGNIFALSESYPQLRASETMQNLQEELRTTENKIAFARQAYNDQVMLYNTSQQQFPAVLLAATFGHHPADLYELTEEKARSAPKVSFS